MPIRNFCRIFQISCKSKFRLTLLVTLLLGFALINLKFLEKITNILNLQPNVNEYTRKGIFPEEMWMFNLNYSSEQFNGNSLRERYIHQVNYIPHNIKDARDLIRSQIQGSLTPVVILVADVMGAVYYKDFNSDGFLKPSQCAVHECYITYNSSNLNTSDVVMFQFYADAWRKLMPTNKILDQIWVFTHIESPRNTFVIEDSPKLSEGKINWTATYRRDSNIYSPYGLYLPNEMIIKWNISHWRFVEIYKTNLKKTRTNLVTAMISNCNNHNKRMDLIQEMRKYTTVDNLTPKKECSTINWNCPRFTGSCFQDIANKYKFIIAFENSNCGDYITEKFFLNALSYVRIQ